MRQNDRQPDSHVGNLALALFTPSAIAECHHISENVAELLNRTERQRTGPWKSSLSFPALIKPSPTFTALLAPRIADDTLNKPNALRLLSLITLYGPNPVPSVIQHRGSQDGRPGDEAAVAQDLREIEDEACQQSMLKPLAAIRAVYSPAWIYRIVLTTFGVVDLLRLRTEEPNMDIRTFRHLPVP